MANLPVDFKDDIMNAAMSNKRRYRMINNSDGTVSFEDVTQYDQVGSDFGAAQVNQTNKEVNARLYATDVVDPMLATEVGFAADALKTKEQVNELNKKIQKLAGARYHWDIGATPESDGSVHICKSVKPAYVLSVGIPSTMPNHYVERIFLNDYGMWYAVIKNKNGNPLKEPVNLVTHYILE